MNTIQKITNKSIAYAQELGPKRLAIVVSVVVVFIVIVAAMLSDDSGVDISALATFEVRQGPLTISVDESGTITNRDQAVVKNEVEGKTTILFVVPEGIQVKEGDLLIELDSSDLEEKKSRQQITVLNTEASFIRARENLAVTKSKNDSDIAEAELKYRFAQLDLVKYVKGEYPQAIQKAEADITIAQEELERANEKVEWSKKLAKEGYVSRMELQADELSAEKSRIDLEMAKSRLWLLDEYTHDRDLAQLDSDVTQTLQALGRVKRRTVADLVQAEAGLRARESEYKRQEDSLEKIEDQIVKCKIYAPVDGMVVYATTGKGNWRRNQEPMEEGKQVREREELICLPTTDSMMIEVKVHESSLTKIAVGMPVIITVDALPGKICYGRVGKIGLLPDAQFAWLNPDLKVYSTEIYLEGDTTDLKPGMTCRSEIIVAQYPEAIFVPVQSVLQVNGHYTVYLPGPNGPEPRRVEVGMDNNRMIQITSGVDVGETILLAPPLEPSSRNDLEVIAELPDGMKIKPVADKATEAEDKAETEGEGEAKAEAKAEGEAQKPTAPMAAAKIDMSKLKDMSSQQRKEFVEKLTPAQRQKLMKKRGHGHKRTEQETKQ